MRAKNGTYSREVGELSLEGGHVAQRLELLVVIVLDAAGGVEGRHFGQIPRWVERLEKDVCGA